MSSPEMFHRPDYNPIADFYQKHWCGHYHSGLMRMLQRLVISNLTSGARVLDVCCGTGTVARHLANYGFKTTGIDASGEMLRYARDQVPFGDFIVADAREVAFPAIFAAAICTFDSLSYMLSNDDLMRVFSNIYTALVSDGVFVFDLSLEETYKREWHRTCSVVEEDEAFFVRGVYDEAERLGQTFITRFHHNGTWQRTDVVFTVRCHELSTICDALHRSGFSSVECYRSNDDHQLRSELGLGRAAVVAIK